MIISLFFALLAAEAPSPTDMLMQCELQRIDPKAMKAVSGESRKFALLVPNPKPGKAVSGLKVYDPTALLKGAGISAAIISEDGGMLFGETDSNRRQYYRIAIMMSKKTGAWTGSIGLNGSGSAEEHLAGSVLGECSVTRGADMGARFEALGR